MQWWLSDLNWDKKQNCSGQGVKIAVIDTGIDSSHKDLKNKIMTNYAVSSLKKEDGSLDHGTAVAGIICAYPSDSKGLLGIAPKSSIISIDVTDNDDGIVETDALAEAVQFAISQQVDIINISVGTLTGSKQLKKAVEAALIQKIFIVASAGNYMEDDILYPAKYDGVIAVGSRTRLHNVISPSKTMENKDVIYLPGENIVTTISNNSYTSAYGTSFSAAMMTGIIALVLEKNNSITYEQLLDCFHLKNNNSINIKQLLEEVKQ